MTQTKGKRGPRRTNYMKQFDPSKIDYALINDKLVSRNIEQCTKENYDRQLQNWNDFLREHPDASVDNLADLKKFIYSIGLGMRAGKDDEETMPHGGLKSYWKNFTAGYRREIGHIREDFVKSVTELIKPNGEIGMVLKIVPDSGARTHATVIHFVWLGEFLWSQDWKVYQTPKQRVEFWALLSSYVFTTSRVSDLIESSARAGTEIGERYDDTQLLLFRNEKGEAELTLQFKKYLKGRHKDSSKLPQANIHEGGAAESPLFMNPMLFLLAMFCAVGALRDYRGIEGLFRLLDEQSTIPQTGVKASGTIIRWHPDVKKRPIFAGRDGKMLRARVFHKNLREAMIRAGFPVPPGLQSFRAEGLHEIDMSSLYSDTQRQKHGGHDNSRIHGQHYAARNAGVDGQSTYLRTEPRTMNISNLFRDHEVKWEPALWQSLPIGRLEAIKQMESYQALRSTIKTPELKGASYQTQDDIAVRSFEKDVQQCQSTQFAVHQTPSELRKLNRDLKKIEKKEQQQSWEEGDSSLESHTEYTCRGVDHPFSRLRPVLPDRNFLADTLMIPATLRSDQGRQALDALVKLHTSTSEVGARPSLERGMCTCTKKKLDQLHIYKCRKKQLDRGDFCFFCNTWHIDRTSWDEHCLEHLTNGKVPVELAWGKILGAIIPGYCVFCLWDTGLSNANRLQSFCDQKEWEDHVQSHDERKYSHCPDPRCLDTVECGDDLVNHLHDIHRVPKRIFSEVNPKRKRGSSFSSDGETGNEGRKKLIRLDSIIFEACGVVVKKE